MNNDYMQDLFEVEEVTAQKLLSKLCYCLQQQDLGTDTLNPGGAE